MSEIENFRHSFHQTGKWVERILQEKNDMAVEIDRLRQELAGKVEELNAFREREDRNFPQLSEDQIFHQLESTQEPVMPTNNPPPSVQGTAGTVGTPNFGVGFKSVPLTIQGRQLTMFVQDDGEANDASTSLEIETPKTSESIGLTTKKRRRNAKGN